MSDTTQVTLPDGRVVDAPCAPQAWWLKDGTSGYVDPNLLAPDPKQPRQDMSLSELQELKTSIGEKGVREPIAVTPRELAPWVELDQAHNNLPFIVVSGHRRRLSAILANVLAVPVRVIVYENEAEYSLDASILNKGRADLTPLEVGMEILNLRNKGVTIDKIAKAFGFAAPAIYTRLNLTRLTPPIQSLLNSGLPKGKKLSVIVAGELGSVKAPTVDELEELQIIFKSDTDTVSEQELIPATEFDEYTEDQLRFEIQKVFLAVIKNRHLPANRACAFIQEHRMQLEAAKRSTGKKPERFQPRKRKEILRNLTAMVSGSTAVDWSPGEFERIFEGDTTQEAEQYRLMIHKAATLFNDLEKILQRIVDTKKHGDAVVLKLRA